MAVFKPVKFFSTTWMIVRHKSKPQIQKTRIPHWIRLQTLETCKPMFDPERMKVSARCDVAKVQKEHSCTTFERLLGEELLKYLEESPMVGFFHTNRIKGRTRFPLVQLMAKEQLTMKVYNRYIVGTTLKNTKYQAIIPLFDAHTSIVFGKHVNVDLLLSIQKKWPAYTLIAGIMENRLMSRDDIENYSKLGNIDNVRTQLCAILNYVTQDMTQSLNYHQMQLGQSLDTLTRSIEKSNSDSS